MINVRRLVNFFFAKERRIVMWTRETSKRIGEILNLIAETPNLRPHPRDSSIKVFDGGLMRVITMGITGYEFTDGTQAIYGMGLDICLTIVFPGGEKVTVSSSLSLIHI